MNEQDLQEVVKQKCGAAGKQAAAGTVAAFESGAKQSFCDLLTKDLYESSEIDGVPQKALTASLGCGNPTALAQLPLGETAEARKTPPELPSHQCDCPPGCVGLPCCAPAV